MEKITEETMGEIMNDLAFELNTDLPYMSLAERQERDRELIETYLSRGRAYTDREITALIALLAAYETSPIDQINRILAG